MASEQRPIKETAARRAAKEAHQRLNAFYRSLSKWRFVYYADLPTAVVAKNFATCEQMAEDIQILINTIEAEEVTIVNKRVTVNFREVFDDLRRELCRACAACQRHRWMN